MPVTPAGHPADLAQRAARRELRAWARTVVRPRLAPPERHRPGRAVAVDLDVEPGRQRVHHRGADAVQTAGGVVRAAAELAARVQFGEDDLDPGQAGPRLDVDRDAACLVGHGDRAVLGQRHVDLRAEAAQRLVDGVVDDLPEAVHEAAGVGRADVHRRPLADRLQTLEDQQVAGLVLAALGGWLRRRHAVQTTAGRPVEPGAGPEPSGAGREPSQGRAATRPRLDRGGGLLARWVAWTPECKGASGIGRARNHRRSAAPAWPRSHGSHADLTVVVTEETCS